MFKLHKKIICSVWRAMTNGNARGKFTIIL